MTAGAGPSAEAPRALAARAVRGSLSVAVASYAGFVLSFAGTAAIARFVGPGEFGVYALAQAYVQVLVATGGFAFTQAVLQSDDESPALADTALVLTLAVRAAVFLVSLGVAWVVLPLQGGPVAGALALLSAVQLLEAAKVAMAMPLQRRIDYGKVARVSLAGNVVAQAGAVAAAAGGWGVSAIVLRDALIAAVPLSLYLLMRRRWRLPDGRRLEARAAREAWRFGRSVWLVRLIDQGLARLDRVVMGGLFSLDAVGCYQQARYIGALPSSAVAPGNLSVAVGMYSRVRQDPARLAKAFDVVQYFVVRIVPPFALVCAVWPELVVSVFLGPRWDAAREPLRIAAAYALLQPVLDSYRTLMEALQWWRLLRWSSVLQSAVTLGLVVALVRFGAAGAVAALAIGVLAAVLFLGVAARRAVPGAGVARHLPAVAATLAAAVGGVALKQAMGHDVPSLVAGAAGGVALYATTLAILERAELRRRVEYVAGLLRDRGGAASP